MVAAMDRGVRGDLIDQPGRNQRIQEIDVAGIITADRQGQGEEVMVWPVVYTRFSF